MPNKNYSRKAEQVRSGLRYARKYAGNVADAKHYVTDESNILYWRKQKLVLAKMPAKNEEPYYVLRHHSENHHY